MIVSPQTVLTFPFQDAKLQVLFAQVFTGFMTYFSRVEINLHFQVPMLHLPFIIPSRIFCIFMFLFVMGHNSLPFHDLPVYSQCYINYINYLS